MPSGDYRTKLILEFRDSTQRDEVGEKLDDNWKPVTDVWVKLAPVSAHQQLVARQSQSLRTHAITMRYRTDVTSANRFRQQRADGSKRIFNIEGVTNVDERNGELLITAVEVNS